MNSENKKLNDRTDEKAQELHLTEGTVSESVALDDEQRVKVLSPSMLVFKRFIRNKLAIVGLVILIIMFLFSFLGGVVSPYRQDQVFKKYDYARLDYATAAYNTELRYNIADGQQFDSGARAQMASAITAGNSSFATSSASYQIVTEAKDVYTILKNQELAKVFYLGGKVSFSDLKEGFTVTPELQAAAESAFAAKEYNFTLDGKDYAIVRSGKQYTFCEPEVIGIASMTIMDAYDQKDEAQLNDVAFRADIERAVQDTAVSSFTSGGVTYQISRENGSTTVLKDGREFASISNIVVKASNSATYIDAKLKNIIREAIADGTTTFTETVDGEEKSFELQKINKIIYIKTDTITQLIDVFDSPSAEHPMGTDQNGMDLLTRLMYGGRVSLTVGFAVVFIEIIIGVLIGGISGYFGGIVDTCLMRFVDLFNSIPQWPVMLILANILDAYKVTPQVRLYLVMVLLGVLGWTGIARIVRGQILSLREQDFMVAAEAAGICVRRKISRHLVPNVMPLLIVYATANLGSIIITEATLSYLGLGIKYPLASWGTIINYASNSFVMENYWWIWLPAGLLILITVLGFNFVGDGLRDAFDPKMKR